jgi:hypothetical protein
MRKRITRALVTAAAAGATITTLGFAAAGPAGAATLAHHITFQPSAPVITTAPCSGAEGFSSNDPTEFPFGAGGCAGYAGSNRNFRYAQALIKIPQTNVVPLTSSITVISGTFATNVAAAAAPTMYVGLTSGDSMAAAGLMTCYNYVQVILDGVNPGLGALCHGVLNVTSTLTIYPAQWVAVGWTAANNGASVTSNPVALPGVSPGDGVKFQVYYPAGGAAHFTVTPPVGSATSFQLPPSPTVLNAVFNHAEAVVDYSASAALTVTTTAGDVPLTETGTAPLLAPGPAPGPVNLRITQFNNGAWTTVGGTRGTFKGVWTLNAADTTSNGIAPPGGTIQVEPAYLWNDGLGGGGSDAFGVWWRI